MDLMGYQKTLEGHTLHTPTFVLSRKANLTLLNTNYRLSDNDIHLKKFRHPKNCYVLNGFFALENSRTSEITEFGIYPMASSSNLPDRHRHPR